MQGHLVPFFPNEIFYSILEQLGDDYRTLGRACLVCRQFRDIAQPLLFKEFRPSHDETQDRGPGETIPILEKLLAEPRLATMVQSLQLDGAIVPAHSLWLDTRGQGRTVRDGLISAVSSGRVPSTLADIFNISRKEQMDHFGWEDGTRAEETLPELDNYNLELKRVDITVSILLVLCPNVKELSISSDAFTLSSIIQLVFEAARTSSSHPLGTTNLLSRLQSLRLEERNYEHSRMGTYKPNCRGYGRPLLPASLESFSADTPQLTFDWAMRTGTDLHYPDLEDSYQVWPGVHFKWANAMYPKLRDLRFFQDAIPSENNLRAVFEACPKLQHLDLWLYPDLEDEVKVDLWDAFGRVLRKRGTKLQSFQLHTWGLCSDLSGEGSFLMASHTSRIGSLRSLHNLRELVIPLDVLVGGSLNDSLALDQVLPRRLELLILSKSLLGAFEGVEPGDYTITRKEQAINELKLLYSKGDLQDLRRAMVM